MFWLRRDLPRQVVKLLVKKPPSDDYQELGKFANVLVSGLVGFIVTCPIFFSNWFGFLKLPSERLKVSFMAFLPKGVGTSEEICLDSLEIQ